MIPRRQPAANAAAALPSSPPMAKADDRQQVEQRSRARQVGVLVLIALGVLFAVLNLDEVSVNWIVGTWRTPLIIVIAVSVLVGAAIGFLIGRQRSADKR